MNDIAGFVLLLHIGGLSTVVIKLREISLQMLNLWPWDKTYKDFTNNHLTYNINTRGINYYGIYL